MWNLFGKKTKTSEKGRPEVQVIRNQEVPRQISTSSISRGYVAPSGWGIQHNPVKSGSTLQYTGIPGSTPHSTGTPGSSQISAGTPWTGQPNPETPKSNQSNPETLRSSQPNPETPRSSQPNQETPRSNQPNPETQWSSQQSIGTPWSSQQSTGTPWSDQPNPGIAKYLPVTSLALPPGEGGGGDAVKRSAKYATSQESSSSNGGKQYAKRTKVEHDLRRLGCGKRNQGSGDQGAMKNHSGGKTSRIRIATKQQAIRENSKQRSSKTCYGSPVKRNGNTAQAIHSHTFRQVRQIRQLSGRGNLKREPSSGNNHYYIPQDKEYSSVSSSVAEDMEESSKSSKAFSIHNLASLKGTATTTDTNTEVGSGSGPGDINRGKFGNRTQEKRFNHLQTKLGDDWFQQHHLAGTDKGMSSPGSSSTDNAGTKNGGQDWPRLKISSTTTERKKKDFMIFRLENIKTQEGIESDSKARSMLAGGGEETLGEGSGGSADASAEAAHEEPDSHEPDSHEPAAAEEDQQQKCCCCCCPAQDATCVKQAFDVAMYRRMCPRYNQFHRDFGTSLRTCDKSGRGEIPPDTLIPPPPEPFQSCTGILPAVALVPIDSCPPCVCPTCVCPCPACVCPPQGQFGPPPGQGQLGPRPPPPPLPGQGQLGPRPPPPPGQGQLGPRPPPPPQAARPQFPYPPTGTQGKSPPPTGRAPGSRPLDRAPLPFNLVPPTPPPLMPQPPQIPQPSMPEPPTSSTQQPAPPPAIPQPPPFTPSRFSTQQQLPYPQPRIPEPPSQIPEPPPPMLPPMPTLPPPLTVHSTSGLESMPEPPPALHDPSYAGLIPSIRSSPSPPLPEPPSPIPEPPQYLPRSSSQTPQPRSYLPEPQPPPDIPQPPPYLPEPQYQSQPSSQLPQPPQAPPYAPVTYTPQDQLPQPPPPLPQPPQFPRTPTDGPQSPLYLPRPPPQLPQLSSQFPQPGSKSPFAQFPQPPLHLPPPPPEYSQDSSPAPQQPPSLPQPPLPLPQPLPPQPQPPSQLPQPPVQYPQRNPPMPYPPDIPRYLQSAPSPPSPPCDTSPQTQCQACNCPPTPSPPTPCPPCPNCILQNTCPPCNCPPALAPPTPPEGPTATQPAAASDKCSEACLVRCGRSNFALCTMPMPGACRSKYTCGKDSKSGQTPSNTQSVNESIDESKLKNFGLATSVLKNRCTCSVGSAKEVCCHCNADKGTLEEQLLALQEKILYTFSPAEAGRTEENLSQTQQDLKWSSQHLRSLMQRIQQQYPTLFQTSAGKEMTTFESYTASFECSQRSTVSMSSHSSSSQTFDFVETTYLVNRKRTKNTGSLQQQGFRPRNLEFNPPVKVRKQKDNLVFPEPPQTIINDLATFTQLGAKAQQRIECQV